jgi:sigma-B regulation protein RsbU (phosphoserine phosphatase)
MLLRRLSLRYKLLGIITLILVVTTTSYLGLAVRLFNADKTAYVFDGNLALTETLGEEAATGILSSLKTMRLAALALTTAPDAAARKTAVAAVVRDDDQFVAMRIARVRDSGGLTTEADVYDDEYLATFQRDAGYAAALQDEVQVPAALLEKAGVHVQNAVRDGGPPLLAVALPIRGESDDKIVLVVSALLRQDRRFAIFQRSSFYTSSMLDGFGNLLAHADPSRVLRRESLAGSPVVDEILESPLAKGVHETLDANGEEIIVAYKKLGIGNLVVISEVPREKAFLPSRKLVEKSAQLAILVLALSMLVSMDFSRRLTAALNHLYLGTLKIAKGDFDVDVAVKSEDEVGALSRSFNQMAREITRLLRETADKARMEKELETAQLVQDNFFPKERLEVGSLEVAAFFRPATECGGDWWGSLRIKDQLILLIGDATGHGVPAALITAAAHSCAMTLARLSEQLEGFSLSPAFIMDSLNGAIYHAGRGRVKMTFFVAVFEGDCGRFRYANASHEVPLICRGHEDGSEPTKDDLDSFDTRPDPCLGESLSTRYHEHAGELHGGDTLLLYTDGITECRNPAKEEYGERRLQRSLVKAAALLSAEEIKDRLVHGAMDFHTSGPLDDDLTLVVVRRKPATQQTRAAS